MIYLLDANTLFEAKNRYYRMAVCPAYWAWIQRSQCAGVVASIDLVGDELRRGNDELAEWAKGQADLFLTVSDDDTQQAFGTVAQHVAAQAGGMKAGALDEFLAGALAVAFVVKHLGLPAACRPHKMPSLTRCRLGCVHLFGSVGRPSARPSRGPKSLNHDMLPVEPPPSPATSA